MDNSFKGNNPHFLGLGNIRFVHLRDKSAISARRYLSGLSELPQHIGSCLSSPNKAFWKYSGLTKLALLQLNWQTTQIIVYVNDINRRTEAISVSYKHTNEWSRFFDYLAQTLLCLRINSP